MKLDATSNVHLTYCTNVHPGETLQELEQIVTTHVSRVREQLGVARFGVGLRIAERAASALGDPEALKRFKDLLNNAGLYVFTLNGFPYGAFHGAPVKEKVYQPDWKTEERLRYTNQLAKILAELLPEETTGCISTVPLGYRPNTTANDEPLLVAQLCSHVAVLHQLAEQTGRHIALGLEPEPNCYLETLREACAFLERGPFAQGGVDQLAQLTGLSSSKAEEALRSHLGVCLDACHMAVEFEAPLDALAMIKAAGVRVTKLQVSAGLSCALRGDPQADAPDLDRLSKLNDSIYLHQVVELHNGRLNRYADLPDALASYARLAGPRQWRVHFHVPVFMRQLEQLGSTQSDLQSLLAEQRRAPFCSHLEVETYTWDVLPQSARQATLTSAIVQEINWTLRELGLPDSAAASQQ
jgi:sugar phosphate isomerase/epimerase